MIGGQWKKTNSIEFVDITNVVDLTVWIPTFGRMKFVETLKLCAPDLEPFKVQGKFLSYDSRMAYN